MISEKAKELQKNLTPPTEGDQPKAPTQKVCPTPNAPSAGPAEQTLTNKLQDSQFNQSSKKLFKTTEAAPNPKETKKKVGFQDKLAQSSFATTKVLNK